MPNRSGFILILTMNQSNKLELKETVAGKLLDFPEKNFGLDVHMMLHLKNMKTESFFTHFRIT